VFLSSSCTVATGKGQIQQEPSAETTEGQAINITCSHPNIQTSDSIHWYRQLPGQGPTFIALIIKGSKAVSEPSGTLLVGAERRSSALLLSQPQRRDAVVYYCTLGA
ncbi:TVA4 protein, partial [Crypturellus undulatus]|nr:TVA4 protein [Crypturellus undulatus]